MRKLLALAAFILTAGAPAGIAQETHAPRKSVDLIVEGATIVTMDPARRVIENASLAVQGDSILAVGPASEISSAYTSARTIRAAGKLLLPGLINAHTHVPMTLLRGISNDVTLDVWLTKFIFPAEARNVNADFVRWGARLGLAEMIRGGTTSYADMYYFEDVIAEETKAAGVRGFLGETWIDFPAPDNKNPQERATYTEAFLRKWQGDPLIQPSVAPHSVYTCSGQTLQDAATLARKYKAPIIIHLEETQLEVAESKSKHGVTPAAWLDQLGVLGPDLLAAHCIWTDDADIRLLADRQVGCAHNPSSNMMLASGVAPLGKQRAAGVRLGLGTDGPAGSNNDLNMMEEMDLAAKLQKISRMDPLALTAKDALEMATIGGARALHRERDLGSLEPGKKADFILLGLDVPNAVPMYDVYAQVVYALKASEVQTVVVAGKVLLQDGKLLTVNEQAAIDKAREYGRQIAASLQQH